MLSSFFRTSTGAVIAGGILVAAASSSSTHAGAGPAAPQPTVITGTHNYGAFVTIRLKSGADLVSVAKAAAKAQGTAVATVLDRSGIEGAALSVDGLPVVMAGVAFSTQLWEQLVAKNSALVVPSGMTHHKTRTGGYGAIPHTGGDILLHVKAPSKSLCYEVTDVFVSSLPSGTIESVSDEYGFGYRDGRDLSDHLDGTMNAAGDEERSRAALVPGGSGGAFVIHQTWLHNLSAWRTLPDTLQERAVGREKPFSTELKPLPPASHVARSRDKDGNRIMVVRQSMPFGSVGGDHGLLFIAYSSATTKFDTMLDRMTGNDKSDAKHGHLNDEIMAMSKCVASNYYYMPSQSELSRI